MHNKALLTSIFFLCFCFSNLQAIDEVVDNLCEDAIPLYPITPGDCTVGEILLSEDGCLQDGTAHMGLPTLTCGDENVPVIWYEVNFDAGVATDLITHVDADGFDPIWYVFSGSCDLLNAVGECSSADGDINNLHKVQIDTSTMGAQLTHYIAITGVPLSNFSSISDYNFILTYGASRGCLACSAESPTDCDNGSFSATVDGEFYDPDQDGLAGPFLPGQRVEVCWDFIYDTSNTGNDWLHGMIPTFGSGWDVEESEIVSQDISGQWVWFSQDDPVCYPRLQGYELPNLCTYSEDGIIKLCNIVCNSACPCATGENVLNAAPLEDQSRLGSGWFWNSPACGDGDCPFQEYGVSGGVQVNLENCIQLLVKTDIGTCKDTDLRIFIQLTSDAVTGCWNDQAPCTLDPSINSPSWKVKCAESLLVPVTEQVCNVDNGFGATSLDFTQFESGIGSWLDVDGSGIDLTDLTNVDFEGLNQGSYLFQFITDDACPNTVNLTVEVIDCDCPVIDIVSFDQLCASENISIDLDDYIIESPVHGTWSIADDSGVSIQGSIVDFSNVLSGMYIFTFTGNAINECPELVRELTINLIDLPTINGVDAVACNQNIGIGQTIIDLNMQLSDETPGGGKWTDTDGVEIDPVIDYTGEPAGQILEYTYTVSDPDCLEISGTITVEVVECLCPLLEGLIAPIFCNDGVSVDLDDFIETDQLGVWTTENAMDTVNGSLVDLSGLPEGDYVYTYTLEEPVGDCPSMVDITIPIQESPVILTTNGEVCSNDLNLGSTSIDLNSLLSSNTTLGGTWTDIDNNLINPIIDFDGQEVGLTTQYLYTIDAEEACPESSGVVEVNVVDCGCPQIISIPADSLCNIIGVIDLNAYSGNQFEGTWTEQIMSGALNESMLDLDSFNTGDYLFTFTLDEPIPNCPSTFDFLLSIVESPSITFFDATVCNDTMNGNQVVLDLNMILEGETPLDGTWFDLEWNEIDPIINFDGVESGTFDYVYRIEGGEVCLNLWRTLTVTVLDCEPNSVQDIATNVDIYPNPFTRLLQVEYPEGQNIKMTVSDIRGQLILVDVSKQNGTYTLDFTSLSSGVFVLSIYEDGYVYNHKVVHVVE